MTTIDVLATLPAPAPAAKAGRKSGGDGFARELEAATRPEARRAHDHRSTTPRAHGARDNVAEVKVGNASDAKKGVAKPGDAKADAKTEAPNEAVTSAAGAELAATEANATASDASSGARGGDHTTDSATTAAALTALVAATTTDSVGPGSALSGGPSQDSTVIPSVPQAAPHAAPQGADLAAADPQVASAEQAGAAPDNHAGTSGSLAIEATPVKVTGSATSDPSASSELPAGPVAVGGATAGGPDAHSADRGARDRHVPNATATAIAPSGAAVSAEANTAGSTPDSAAPIAQSGPAAAATTPAMAAPDAGLQVTATAAPSAAPAAAPASPSLPTLPVPLASQLSGQLTSLRQLPQGEHVLTLTVNPETFGPVKVIARITHDGVSLQVFGASDEARAALKAALPDLRRDLAGAGLEPRLELGSGSGSGSGARDPMGDPSSFAGNGGAPRRPGRPPFGGAVSVATVAATPTTHATRRGGLDLVL